MYCIFCLCFLHAHKHKLCYLLATQTVDGEQPSCKAQWLLHNKCSQKTTDARIG